MTWTDQEWACFSFFHNKNHNNTHLTFWKERLLISEIWLVLPVECKSHWCDGNLDGVYMVSKLYSRPGNNDLLSCIFFIVSSTVSRWYIVVTFKKFPNIFVHNHISCRHVFLEYPFLHKKYILHKKKNISKVSEILLFLNLLS